MAYYYAVPSSKDFTQPRIIQETSTVITTQGNLPRSVPGGSDAIEISELALTERSSASFEKSRLSIVDGLSYLLANFFIVLSVLLLILIIGYFAGGTHLANYTALQNFSAS